MGIFDFVKEAGAKIFGDDDEKAAQEAAEQAEPEVNHAREAFLKQERNTRLAQRIELRTGEYGFEIEDFTVSIHEGIATITGTVPSQTMHEQVVLMVGNTEGIGQVDSQIEVVEPEPEATFYTVVKGDTLSKIAKAHYGAANKYPEIFEANKPMLTDPDKIYPGQVLRIPPQEEVANV